MIKEFQNNCLLYTCKKDYRFFKKGKRYFAGKIFNGLIIVFAEKGSCYFFFPEIFYSVFKEEAQGWE